MYDLGKSALVALLTAALASSSPAPAGVLPPVVECVDGQPVGVNVPLDTLPKPFTVQVIASATNHYDLGSLPLVLGKQQGTSDFFATKLGAVSPKSTLSLTLTDSTVYVNGDEDTVLAGVRGHENELDLGIGPNFGSNLVFQAEYVCRNDNTPVLALTLPATTTLFDGSTTPAGIFDVSLGLTPGKTIQIRQSSTGLTTVSLQIIGGTDDLL